MNHRQAPTVRLRRGAGPTVEPDATHEGGASTQDASADPARSPTLPAPPPTSPPAAAFTAAASRAEQTTSPEIPRARAVPRFRADDVPPAELVAARLPDGYELVELVHKGRWADVWRASDEQGHRVAVKLALSRTPEAVARFAVEARALASLTHRSIVRLHAHGETSDRRPFLALEWLSGPTLTATIHERQAGLPPGDAIRLLVPIANAILLAHDRGVVHGDVRAEHVVLVPLAGDRILPKLIDFGGSLRAPLAAPRPCTNEPTRHAAPSSPGDQEGNPAVDVRAFASLIFHAIMGRPPFDPAAPAAGAASPEVPRSGLSDRDAALWRILAEGLAPLTVKRRQSLHDFAKALAQWADLRGVEADVTGSSILTRWSSPPPPGDRRGPPRGGEDP